jgi:hypothetical protein
MVLSLKKCAKFVISSFRNVKWPKLKLALEPMGKTEISKLRLQVLQLWKN